MSLAGIKFFNAADGCWYELTNDKWITIHPNGEDKKGQPLLVKSGETPADAIERKFHPKQKELFGKDVDLGKKEYKKETFDEDEEEEDTGDTDKKEEQYRAYEYQKQKDKKKIDLMSKFGERGLGGFREAKFTYKGAKIIAKERMGNVYGDVILPSGKKKYFDTSARYFEQDISKIISGKE